MSRRFLLATLAASFLTAGPALALDNKPIGIQHADIARARAALDVLSPDQRLEAEFLLDEARSEVNNRQDNGYPERAYNKVVDMIHAAERARGFAIRQ